MKSKIPLFKSHYSIGRSILTLEKAGESIKTGPDSIIDLALDNKLSKIVLIEDSMIGLPEAATNCNSANIDLHFGVRLTVTADSKNKTEESEETSHKCIIMAKNESGIKSLIKIYTNAYSEECFYYEPRTDFDYLVSFWNENLQLCIPFYDSFLYQNSLTFNRCVPDFNVIKPVFFLEDNGLPFDPLLREKVKDYTGDKYETVETQSVYYAARKDFKAYLTYKCLNKRTVLNKPNLEHCMSDSFCLENII